MDQGVGLGMHAHACGEEWKAATVLDPHQRSGMMR